MEVKENDFIKIWIQDGVLYGVYKKGAVIGLKQAKELILLRKSLTPNKNLRSIVYLSNIKTISAEARKYMASDEATEDFERMAFITQSLMIKMLGNSFLKFDRPKIPTKLFTNEKDALEWLTSDKVVKIPQEK